MDFWGFFWVGLFVDLLLAGLFFYEGVLFGLFEDVLSCS